MLAAYTAVASRRIASDNLLWQVPSLSLTAQAFLFTIALSNASSKFARIVSMALSIGFTALALQLMTRHRQCKRYDGAWIEKCEMLFFSEFLASRVLTAAGDGIPEDKLAFTSGAEHRESRSNSDPGAFPVLNEFGKLSSYKVWAIGFILLGFVAIAVMLLAIFSPDTFQ